MTTLAPATAQRQLADAASLARSGRYREAHRVLAELGGEESQDAVVLDLLARLHAQQGELAEADACWARALDAGPDPATATRARAGRRRIAALQARRYGPSAGRRLTRAALVLAVAGAVVAGTLVWLGSGEGSGAATEEDLAALRNLQSRLSQRIDELTDSLNGDLDQLKGDIDDVANSQQRSASELAEDLDGPGTTVTRQDDALLITFDDGLFAADGQDTTLTAEGRDALEDVATRLRKAAVAGPVVVTGHTDDTPLSSASPYSDRVNLGYARAQTAAEEIAGASSISLDSIGIRSRGTTDPPFPNDSAANRARNNTVTLLIGLG